MAHGKIRALHPEFFADDDLAEVSIPARLLFAGLWCFACDNGHVIDKPKQIKRWIYATDDVNVAELLRELEAQALISRADGWLIIPNLPRRQKVDGRYFKTCDHCETDPTRAAEEQERRAYGLHVRWHVNKGRAKDGCPHCERETRSGAQKETRSRATTNPVVDGDGDGDGDGDSTTYVVDLAAGAANTKRATQRPADFRPTPGHIALAEQLGVDLRAEWQQFCDHHDAKGSTYKDWSAALRTWIRNAAKFSTRRTTTPRQQADADMFARMEARAAAHEARGEIA